LGVSADILAMVIPGQMVNLFISTFTIYLVGTAWLAAKRTRDVPVEMAAFAVVLVLAILFTTLSVQLAIGAKPVFHISIPFEGPALIAMYVFTGLLLVVTVADLRLLLAGGISGRARIGCHLWRMCLGLTFAAGSAFTNGLPRVLLHAYSVAIAVCSAIRRIPADDFLDRGGTVNILVCTQLGRGGDDDANRQRANGQRRRLARAGSGGVTVGVLRV
jgi:hypothetical protein